MQATSKDLPANLRTRVQCELEVILQVIPEFDMPGHSYAAVKAMEARYNSLIDSDEDAAR